MAFDQRKDDDRLLSAVRAPELQAVSWLDGPVRLGPLVVHVHLATTAGPLRFRPGLEQTRDVQPDVQPKVLDGRCIAWHEIVEGIQRRPSAGGGGRGTSEYDGIRRPFTTS